MRMKTLALLLLLSVVAITLANSKTAGADLEEELDTEGLFLLFSWYHVQRSQC